MNITLLGRRLPEAATYAAALAASLLLLLITIAGALWQNDQSAQINAEMRAHITARVHLRSLLVALQEAEASQRGYIITRDESYLDPYLAARDSIHHELAAIEAVPHDGERAGDIAQLRALAEAKIREMTLTAELVRSGRMGEAQAIVRSDRGKQLMDEARGIILAAIAHETEQMYRRMAEADDTGQRLRIVIVLAGLMLIGIGALLVFAVRRTVTQLRISRDAAETAHLAQIEESRAREAAETKVRQMQKMETIGQITGGVAHDFNNMLAVILSALQLARRRLERGQQGAEQYIEAAADGARRAAALTRRLLAFARRQPLTPQVLTINRVLGDMSDMLSRTLGEEIEVETVLAAGLWNVHADRNELEQAILNVCVNARDAMPSGGKLTIEAANSYLDEEYAAAATEDIAAGQYVMIAITDTGVGMSPEVRAQAFEPFFTTKEVGKGTGLGLSHVHGFLKQSGGHVAIYSELGVGTTIKLYLPRTALAASEADGRAAAPEAIVPAGDAETLILVVEDDERVRVLSVAALRDLGYTVIHANAGERALALLEEHPAVALLFTDVVMPGMSGRVLADTARQRWPHLKVLYTTGYTQNAIVHNGIVDADARLILKPYTLHDLARKVRAALDE